MTLHHVGKRVWTLGPVSSFVLSVWSLLASINEFLDSMAKTSTCVVCYTNETMTLSESRFQVCGHGTQLCVKCQRKCTTCPLCRNDKDATGKAAKRHQFGLIKPLTAYTFVDTLIACSLLKFTVFTWQSAIVEFLCDHYLSGTSMCGTCISRTWMRCVRSVDWQASAQIYVFEMVSSPLYWILVVAFVCVCKFAGFYEMMANFNSPETPRHVHQWFSGEEKLAELLKLQTALKKLTFKDTGGNKKAFEQLSGKHVFMGSYHTERIACTLFPRKFYNWKPARIWMGRLLPLLKTTVFVMGVGFLFTELKEDFDDPTSGTSKIVYKTTYILKDDVGVMAGRWLSSVLRLGYFYSIFWIMIDYADGPLRGIVYLKPLHGILKGLLNMYHTGKVGNAIKSLWKFRAKKDKAVHAVDVALHNAAAEIRRRNSAIFSDGE